jgi:uncharacterized membrane protein HdeD (DUF308 family)
MVVQNQAVAMLRDWRGAFLASGAVCLVLGIILLVWPGGTLRLIAILLGIALLLLGASRLVSAATDRDEAGSHRLARAAAGVLWLVAGILVLTHLHATLRTFAVIVALAWIVAGAAEAYGALTRGGDGRTRALIIGLLNIAFGIILIVWTKPTVTVLIWLIGLWLIALGLLQLYLGYRTGREARRISDAPGRA